MLRTVLPILLVGSLLAQPQPQPQTQTQTQARAGLELGPPFRDHMVLQRGVRVAIWGRAEPRARVIVKFAGQKLEGIVDRDGAWTVQLEPLAVSARSRKLVTFVRDGDSAGQTVALRDVLVGDVWMCAGQSNMRFPLQRDAQAKAALASADLPTVRLFDFHGRVYPSRKKYELSLLRSITAANYYTTKGWQRSTAATAGPFSAVAWWFGAKLSKDLGVPIGLIHNAVGGVPIESYLPAEFMRADAKLRGLLERWWENEDYPAWCRKRGAFNLTAWRETKAGVAPHHPFEPGFLFDAGVRPFVRFAIKGVLWYQGESNATVDGGLGAPVDPDVNEHKLNALVRSWRAAFGRESLPFYYAQLPGLNRPWVPFREVQWRVARQLRNVGCAVTLDVGHPTDVHPRHKRAVGQRLALLALRDTYGKRIVAEGPVFAGFEKSARGLRLQFDNALGMTSADGKPLRCFEVAGEDGTFHAAVAKVDRAVVLVTSEHVAEPVAVRYAWANDPQVNFVNGAGLPAAPFHAGPKR